LPSLAADVIGRGNIRSMPTQTHTALVQKLAAALAAHRAEIGQILSLIALDEQAAESDLCAVRAIHPRNVLRGPLTGLAN
jgi:hypothetical protein